MDVRLPDGTIIRNVPDGMSKADLTAKLKANGYDVAQLDAPPAGVPETPQETTAGSAIARTARMLTPAGLVSALASKQGRADLGNVVAGGVRGAGSIGATLLAPVDMATDAAAGKGPSLESNRARRVAMDQTLQDMGADPNSIAYQGGKLATEVGGTWPVGGLVGNAVGKVAPRVGQAIASGGFSTGARVAPGVMPAVTDLALRSAGGVANAGLTAGLINPEDVPAAMAVGGTLPLVTKAAGAIGHSVGAAVSPKLANAKATQKIAGELGDGVPQAIADIQTYYPKGAENIPASAAAITKNPSLARLEQGSRLNSSPAWYEFDQRQGRAIFDNVMDATKEAGELGARKGTRAENWTQAWTKASESQKPRIWKQRMTQFGADLEQAMRSPQASNPDVRRVLEAINEEFDRVGPAFTPAHLQQLRANLNGKTQALSTDVFKSAPRDNPAIISLIKEMDDILNVSTGGKWQKVIEGYAKDSQGVRASAAASKVRGAFVDRDTGRTLGTALNPDGDIAKVTEAGLGRAMNAARQQDGSLALSGDALNKLEATLDVLRRQNIVQGVKRSATAGGGSDTVPNAIAAGATAAGERWGRQKQTRKWPVC
jgi:hypothetical protein